MRDNKIWLNDAMTLGSNLLGHLMGARHEMKAQARERMDGLVRALDLVSREEFDAAFAMLAKARALQDQMAARIAELEKRLGIVPASAESATAKTKNTASKASAKSKHSPKTRKASLPSVKDSNRGGKRR